MMGSTVQVVTPAASQDLTTLADVCAAYGWTPGQDAARDALVAALITQASAAILRFCRRRSFARQTYLETIDGYGQQTMILSETPIVGSVAAGGVVTAAVRDLNKLGDEVTDYAVRDFEAGLLFRDLSWDLSAEMGSPFRDWPIPDSAVQPYSVTYDAGYCLPGQSQWSQNPNPDSYDQMNAQALPSDVERAAIITVQDWYNRRTQSAQRVTSKSVDGLRLDYAQPTAVGEVPTPGVILLSSYVRDA